MHHSHITGQIIGYSQNFRNTKVIEKSNAEILLIAHNFFGFDLFYLVKTYVASAWCSKEVNVGGNPLTQASYGSINNEIKLIDSLKYYQKSLSQLSCTMTTQEKMNVKKLAEKFLTEHHYFSTVWLFLPIHKKNKNLEIIAKGKGVIPYEIIVDMESFFITPDKDFWEKSEFFSELKLRAVDDESYENSK